MAPVHFVLIVQLVDFELLRQLRGLLRDFPHGKTVMTHCAMLDRLYPVLFPVLKLLLRGALSERLD